MSLITGTTLKALTDSLKAGADLETSCHFAGLHSNQVLKWLEIGKNEAERRVNGYEATPDYDEHVELWDELKRARASAIVRNVTQVQRAAQDGQWQAAAWWLERTVPEHYAKKTAKRAPAVVEVATENKQALEE